ncbi:putative reverse transcriptase zinc-binding domain-containing protein [Helianthus annuus]|nr:putative reverse transcriptase zinc-binding domain-containing protein [Helianthus annuus]
MRRDFLWGGSKAASKMCWVAWDDIMAPRDLGGVGIHALRDTNIAMLAKWWWRFKEDRNGLWRKVIWGFHNNSSAWSSVPGRLALPGIWKQVAKIIHDLSTLNINLPDLFRGIPGNGSDISFWHDCWVLDVPLEQKFPVLYALESNRHVCIADRISVQSGSVVLHFNWRRQFNSAEEFSESGELMRVLNSVSLHTGPDRWAWAIDATGSFSVKSLRGLMQKKGYSGTGQRFAWNNWALLKLNFLPWRVFLGRLPTLVALRNRNVQVPSVNCPICGNDEETIEHLFIACPFAQQLWDVVSRWVKISALFLLERSDLIYFHSHVRGSGRWKKVIYLVMQAVVWCTWRARNDLVFNRKQPRIGSVIDDIKSLSFLWFKSRARMVSLTWEQWCGFNANCMGC